MDDFAFRRGHTYGTVLVDVEGGKPFDVLPDRRSETLLAWLEAHPGAEVICRDRATGYTRAIKQAAHRGDRSGRPVASAAESVRCGGEDMSPAPRLPAETRSGAGST
ncbi:transposase [Streptomyces flavotricini]|uniref:Transposase n=1 Tax=Streptomyces flavotricini TaxID=66888 RepID=A0ABS8EHS0_9ACTN|nr:transposase [Streptomyces flavotricini]